MNRKTRFRLALFVCLLTILWFAGKVFSCPCGCQSPDFACDCNPCPATPKQCPGGVCPTGPVGQVPLLPQAPAIQPPALLRLASVKLHCTDGKEAWVGSGVIFRIDGNNAYILSNAHVVPHAGVRVLVYHPHYPRPFVAVFVAATKAQAVDLSCVRIQADKSMVYVPLADSSKTEGESVWQVGYPGGGEQHAQYFTY